jgi:trimethylamine:corrinoid methyltransferase-like protein
VSCHVSREQVSKDSIGRYASSINDYYNLVQMRSIPQVKQTSNIQKGKVNVFENPSSMVGGFPRVCVSCHVSREQVSKVRGGRYASSINDYYNLVQMRSIPQVKQTSNIQKGKFLESITISR